MRNALLTCAILTLIAFGAPSLHSQTTSGAQAGAGQAIPDLSGIWEMPVEQILTANNVCGENACAEVLGLNLEDLVVTVEEPQMLPWAEEQYVAAREDPQNPKSPPREVADPWFSACQPSSPAWFTLNPGIAIELRQFSDEVLLLHGAATGEGDHAVRRVYMDGRGHPANLKPTWMGHSIGRYDGDTLVVDTIGIKSTGTRWLDMDGHPHTDALHLVERIRRVDANSMEFEVTMDDPQAYQKPRAQKIVRKRAVPGPRIWDEANCSEILQMGTHYGAEAR